MSGEILWPPNPIVTSGNGTYATPHSIDRKGRLIVMDPAYLCPDILDLDLIGPADYARGRVVRAFFRLMRLWPVK